MTALFDEAQVVLASIEMFENIGYTYAHGPDRAADPHQTAPQRHWRIAGHGTRSQTEAYRVVAGHEQSRRCSCGFTEYDIFFTKAGLQGRRMGPVVALRTSPCLWVLGYTDI